MADNIDISPGVGATVATDEAGGRHYQRVKLADGAEGSAARASVRADGTQEVSLTDLAAALYAILEAIARPISQEPGTGNRLADPQGGMPFYDQETIDVFAAASRTVNKGLHHALPAHFSNFAEWFRDFPTWTQQPKTSMPNRDQ